MEGLKGKFAIVGIGNTKFGKLPGSTPLALNLEACKKALDDSGLTKDDVDGLLTMQPLFDPTFMFSCWIAEYLGISLKYTTDLNIGGATPVSMVKHAVMAINTGFCEVVLCTFGENFATGPQKARHGKLRWGFEEFKEIHGMAGPTGVFAAAARRHMYEYGTTSAQLGAIAVAMRKHASLNENAFLRKPITIEDHQNSRFIVEPFRLLDCSVLVDGGAAVVVTSAERAMHLKNPPIYILGLGEAHVPKHSKFFLTSPSITTVPAKMAGAQAFQMAGITPNDVDVAEIYDCFTWGVLVQLEDLGFCKKGEGGPFVEGGRIELRGDIPVNTHGGLLSEGHVCSMNHIVEAVRQLRGVCGKRQVEGAEIALVTGFEESAAGTVLILSSIR